MLGWKKDRRLHMVIKDHTVRYFISPPSEPARMEAFGEEFLTADFMKDGFVQNLSHFEMFINEIVEKYRLKKTDLYFTVPDSSVILRHMTIPMHIKDDEVKGYFYKELGETIHLPYEWPVFDYAVLDDTENGKRVLLVAYPQKVIQQYEESFTESQLKPKAADLSSLSVYRVYEQVDLIDENEHLLVVEWSVNAISVTAFHKGIPQFSRQINSPLSPDLWKPFRDQERTHLHWTGEIPQLNAYVNDQIGELIRIMNFYQFSVTKGEAAITRIVLAGDWPYFNEMYDKMSEEMNVTVDRLSLHELGMNLPDYYADVVGLVYKP
ncbi:hypothetical protein EQV77_01145 [Halobacillus fulvus]|nr:hypothetical protein EQV77_01145 [Halobacillus fulvus]